MVGIGAAETSSTDQLIRTALVTLLTQQQKKKKKVRIPGLVEDGSDDDEGDGLGPISGARGTLALEKLHRAMQKHPGAFADRMEVLAAAVDGSEVDKDLGLNYVRTHLPVGRQRTLGNLMFVLGHIHQALKEQQLDRARFLTMAAISMGEQFSMDENWTAAWKVYGLPAPPWSDWAQADTASLRRDHAHSRLMDSRWTGAAIGAMKDEEVLRKRRGKGGGKKGEEPKEEK